VVVMSKNVESNSFAGISEFTCFSRFSNANFCCIVSIEMISGSTMPVTVDWFNVMLSRVSITEDSFTLVSMLTRLSYMSSSNLLDIGSIKVVMIRVLIVSINRSRTRKFNRADIS
jgi:hypothetical protein